MTTITFNNWQNQYDVPDEVASEVEALNFSYRTLLEAVNEVRIKEQTAREHPTRDTRLLAWKAKRELYKLLPGAFVEQELFR